MAFDVASLFSAGDRFAYGLSYQISPIILTGGIAGDIPGGMLPILSLTQPQAFPTGLLGAGGLLGGSLDDYMMHFAPLPGGTLVEQKIGEFPFANQAVAANAVIRDPLNISMLMFIHVAGGGLSQGGYQTKSEALLALKATLDQHNSSGGTYTVATPGCFYTDCVMVALRDVSRRDVNQPQNAYQWDFRQPLISMAAAQQAYNNQMSQINSATPSSTSPTGQAVGTPPTPGPTASTAPAASGPSGAGVAGSGPQQSFGPVQAAGG